MKRQSKGRVIAVVAVFVMLQVVVALVFLNQPDQGPPGRQANQQPRGRNEIIEVGGVRRPATDIRPLDREDDRREAADEPMPQDAGGKRATPVPVDLNPNVQSVHEALTTGKFPERVSSFIRPKPFDKEMYLDDPQAYLDIVEPGRVWQPAQPGPDVPRIKRLTSRYVPVEQGEPVSLRVEVPAGAPVTYTSFDLGEFHNRLTSVTVRADEEGIAVARFTGTPGTVNYVNILAASPMTSGQVKFIVHVSLPDSSNEAAN